MKLYVSCNAKKGGDGSLERPFTTIERAQTFVKNLVKEGLKEEIHVKILKGHYTMERPLVFTEEDSGLEEYKITYEGEEGTILSGGKTIMPHWEAFDANPSIMVAQLEKNLKMDGLVIGGEHYTLARFPNEKPGVLPLGSTTSAEVIKERCKKYNSPRGGYIRALHDKHWGGNSYIIEDKDHEHETGLKLKWIGDNNRGCEYDPNNLVIENIFEELDVEAEWYYDRATGLLYVYPKKGISLKEAEVELVLNSDLIRFQGSCTKSVQNIEINNIVFKNTKRTMFTTEEEGKNYWPLLRGDWAVVRSGVITLENSSHISIHQCCFKNIGGNAIFVNGSNNETMIDNNEFINLGASGIQVVGYTTAVHDPSFWEHEYFKDNEAYPIHKTEVDHPNRIGPKSEEYPKNIVISNNYIYNIGIFEKQSSGINLSICKNIKIIHNTIHKSARSCINVNDGTFGGHEIAWNDIFDSQRETKDHGPFNSWGRDRFWSVPKYNASGLYGEIVRPFALLDVIEPIEIHHNRFHHGQDQPHTWGIDLDDGSSHYEIHHNLCLGMGIKLREGFDRHVYNNILVGQGMNIHCTYAFAKDKIHDNMIIASTPWNFAGMSGEIEQRLKRGELQIDQNIYYSPVEVEMPKFWSELEFDVNGIVLTDLSWENTLDNDYRVLNIAKINKSNFENFRMDAFGKQGCKHKSPHIDLARLSSESTQIFTAFWHGAKLSDLDDGIISSTATSGYNGVYFEQVPTDTEAYKMGFRSHDVLKELNGNPIDNTSQFVSQFSIEKQNTYKIFRQGQYMN